MINELTRLVRWVTPPPGTHERFHARWSWT